jgi:hypothetical protein
MADFATNLPVTPYNPQGGMQTLQGILGIQAQKLDIQRGQQDLQTATANAQQAQQKNQELQNLAQFTQKAVNDPAYKMPDGSPNIAKYQSDASAVAPVYGQDAIGRYTENFRSAVNTRKDLQSLSDSQNKSLSGFFASVAGMKNPTHDDILNAASQARSNNQDPAFNRALDRALMNFDPKLSPQDIKSRAQTATNTLAGITGMSPSSVETAGSVQPGATNQYTGAFIPAGAPITKPPTPVQGPGGQILSRDPRTGELSLPPVAASAPNVNPTAAQQATTMATATGVAGRVQQAQAAANNTIQAQDALNRARTLLDNPSLATGAGFDSGRTLGNAMAAAGIDTQGATDANTLVKNLARYEAARATQAGLGGTDAARELAHNGSPNTAVDQNALKGMVTQSLATERALAAYARIQSRTTDPGTQQKNESDFRNIPHLIEGYEYGLARNPKEAEQFLGKHGISPEQMAQIRAQIHEFEAR